MALSNATDDRMTGHPSTGGKHPSPENTGHPYSPVPSGSNVTANANASRDRVTTHPVEVQSSPLTTHERHREDDEESKTSNASREGLKEE